MVIRPGGLLRCKPTGAGVACWMTRRFRERRLLAPCEARCFRTCCGDATSAWRRQRRASITGTARRFMPDLVPCAARLEHNCGTS